MNGEPAPEDFSKREKDGGTAKARVRHGLVDFYVDSVIVRESIGPLISSSPSKEEETVNIFKKKNLVGLDIGTYGVKVVELLPMSKKNREGFQLAGIGYEPLPPQSIVEGSIMDFTAVAETVSKALDGAHIKNRNVAISLSGTSVITRKFMLQNLKGEDLEGVDKV